MISAPFTPEQVVELWKYQLGIKTWGYGDYQIAGHPFTCPNRMDADHKGLPTSQVRWEQSAILGMLIPITKGWICPFCDYAQSWAHEFMCIPVDTDPSRT